MSVITESLENYPIIIISNFVACEYEMEFDWKYAREFKLGEVVYYVDDYKDENIRNEHLQWMVKFRTKDGGIYSASQLYFVTEDAWKDIEEYIKSNLDDL
ncbi:hypothetical protein KHQ81_06455 [Mycoplasmatota bacterium]|nr:hypothetical protein KHQ81_06455 [Mycoplasmatota bacterium]